LTSIDGHVACAAQVNSDITATTTELIYEVFITWFPLVLLFLVSSFFPGCDFFAGRLFLSLAKTCFYLLKRKPRPKPTIPAGNLLHVQCNDWQEAAEALK
jgi:hypothetical protein